MGLPQLSDRYRVILIHAQTKAAKDRAPDQKNLLLEDFLYVLDLYEQEAKAYDELRVAHDALQAEYDALKRKIEEEQPK